MSERATAESVCPNCGGSGWKIIEKDGISAADRCSCQMVDIGARLEEKSRIPVNYAFSTFEKFSLGEGLIRDQLILPFNAAKRYADRYPEVERPGILFVGETGTGKTHLAVAAAKALMQRGHEVIFFNYQELLERIRAGYNAIAGSSDREVYRQALDAEILLLDDLGAHRAIEWVEDTINSIITYRCDNRKPLIATTNLLHKPAPRTKQGPTDFADLRKSLPEILGERTYSRLHEMCTVVKMPAVSDYRLGGRR